MLPVKELLPNSPEDVAIHQTSQSTSKPASLANVELLFAELAALYGARLADLWAGSNLDRVKEVWTQSLAGFKVGEINAGLEACKRRSWPPTLPEFIELCRPLPDYEGLFNDAQNQLWQRSKGEDKWQSKAQYWAALEFGEFELRNASWIKAKNKWIRILDRLLSRDDLPPVPPFMLALPSPESSFTNTEVVRVRLAKLKQTLNKPRERE